MKYAWIVVAGWVLASGSAMCADFGGPGGPDFPQSPGKTRYQVLQEAYDSATEMPIASDFIPPPKTDILCAGALPSKPDVLNPYYVRVVRSTIQEGVPGFGPLFPPTKPIFEATVIFGNEQTVAQQSPAGFNNRIGKAEFEIHVTTGTYHDVTDPVVVMFRKKADYLPFKAVRIVNGVPSEEPFVRGYCYLQPRS